MIRQLLKLLLRIIDVTSAPITCLSGYWLKNVRRAFHQLPLSRKILRRVGVLPIRHHYEEPYLLEQDLLRPLTVERTLPGLDLNVPGQLALLEQFDFNTDLIALPLSAESKDSFHYHNGNFESGDAEFLFNMIRHFKPSKIVEIGSGYSTLMARYAIRCNQEEEESYNCQHICIEPYEQPWLEEIGVEVTRKRVETIEPEFFKVLGTNDILFIDSSHTIRPQGDVLFEYLEILGSLKPGVIIHAHDIFTPRDYLDGTLIENSKLWNEQYLLEAFLCFNGEFTVIGSLNFLWHNYREQLTEVCPVLGQELFREPGSFWFRRD